MKMMILTKNQMNQNGMMDPKMRTDLSPPKIKIEDVTHRLSVHIIDKYNMDQMDFLKEVCFDIVPYRHLSGYERGMRAMHSMLRSDMKCVLLGAEWMNKYYLFDSSDRDVSGWVSLFQSTPDTHKKYTESSLVRSLKNVILALTKQNGLHWYARELGNRSYDVLKEELARELRFPSFNMKRKLWPYLNHPLMSADLWMSVRNLIMVDQVHSS